MAQKSDLEARECVVWRTKPPLFFQKPPTSSSFAALGSVWYLQMNILGTSSTFLNYYAISLHSESEKDRLENCPRVTTFLEEETGNGVLPLSCSTIVECSGQNLWEYKESEISALIPRFLQDAEVKVVCMFHSLSSHVPDSKNEIFRPLCQKDLKFALDFAKNNLKKFNLTSDKSVQTTLDFSPDLEDLSEDFRALLEDKTCADVRLRCRDHTVFAHKTVLAARSEVFSSMFQNKITKCQAKAIDVSDLDPVVLDMFLKFVYSGKIPRLPLNVVPSLYAASATYAVHALKEACSKRMIGILTEDNCLHFWLLANAYNDTDFEKAVVSFVKSNLKLLRSEKFSRFSKEHPRLAVTVYEKCFSELFNK